MEFQLKFKSMLKTIIDQNKRLLMKADEIKAMSNSMLTIQEVANLFGISTRYVEKILSEHRDEIRVRTDQRPHLIDWRDFQIHYLNKRKERA